MLQSCALNRVLSITLAQSTASPPTTTRKHTDRDWSNCWALRHDISCSWAPANGWREAVTIATVERLLGRLGIKADGQCSQEACIDMHNSSWSSAAEIATHRFFCFFLSHKSKQLSVLFRVNHWIYRATFTLRTIFYRPKPVCQFEEDYGCTHKYKSGASAVASHSCPRSQEKVPSAFAFSTLSPGAKGHSVKLECARRTESWDFLWGSCERLAIFRLARGAGLMPDILNVWNELGLLSKRHQL